MAFSDHTDNLRIETDSGGYRISPAEAEKMDRDLDTLRKLVADFPVTELKIELTQQNPSEIRVATSLRLPARTLFAADEDRQLHPAWERCVRRLMHQVTALKEKLDNKPVYSKQNEGTLHEVSPSRPPDAEAIQRAVEEQDYQAFRQAMAVYEESLELRVGRWVQRYPEAQAQLGAELSIPQIAEAVLLNAFEQFENRPPLRLGEWIESLIDPSLQALLRDSGDERENLSFIESAKEADIKDVRKPSP